MRKGFIFMLLATTTLWGQSTWDTALLGGVNSNKEPYGSTELRLGVPIVKNTYIVGSGNFIVTGIPTRTQGLTHRFDLNLYPRVGVMYSLWDKIGITSGVSIMNRTKGWWPVPYIRTDIKILGIEDKSIMGVIDIQKDGIGIGVSFKDVINQ